MGTLPLNQGIPRFKTNEDRLDRIVNGSSGETVVVDSGIVPTLSGLLQLSQVTGGTVAATWTELASYVQTQQRVPGMVENTDEGTHVDPITGKTVPNAGIYQWSNSPSGWKWLGYGNLAGATFQRLPPESGFVGAIVDGAGRACLKIAADGTVTGKLSLQTGAVGLGALDAELSGFIAKAMPAESGFVWAIVDSTNRVAIGIGNDGAVTVRVSKLIGKSVGEANLLDALARRVMPRDADRANERPDKWRQQTADIAMTTSRGEGSLFKPFPSRRLRLMRGFNSSGASLDIRKSLGLLILGASYGGAWSPGAWPASGRNLGGIGISGPSFGAPTAAAPYSAGDYYQYANGAGDTSTGTYAGMRVGDLLVYGSDAAWHIQAAPGSGTTRARNAWWAVSAAGVFDGVTYAVGDRILYVSHQPGGGGQQFQRFAKMDLAKGDLAYRGEFAPSGGMPSAPSSGEVYQASAAGTAGGFTFALGDYALYSGTAWQQLPNAPITTYAAGASVVLPCGSEASEWEVRRTDKNATSVGVRLQAQVSSIRSRPQDLLWLLSDSMFGTGGTGSLVLSKTGREGQVTPYGGGTSDELVSMLEYMIMQGDAYRGATVYCLGGQNNQPSISEYNAALIRETALLIWDLIGSIVRRVTFLSVLGMLSYSWNGVRLVASQLEDQFGRTGALYELEQWYAREFPGMWLSPRQILLARAAQSTAPHPQYPGMTEGQVATTYGVLPLSYYAGSSLPVTAASLVYKGTWSTAGLPTGGTANDYYIRTSNGTIGALLINVAGTWIEFTWDATHLSNIGADILSDGIVADINAKGF